MSYTDFRIHEIRVGQIHRRPTRPKIRVGLVLHVLHGSGAYAHRSCALSRKDSIPIIVIIPHVFNTSVLGILSCHLTRAIFRKQTDRQTDDMRSQYRALH